MALQFGASVFEGNKAYRGNDVQAHLFRLSEHFDRLKASADRLCLICPSHKLFVSAIEQAVAQRENWSRPFSSEWLYVRPVLVGLDDHIMPVISQECAFYVLVAPIRTFDPVTLTLSVISHQHRATPGGLGAAKTAANYAHQFQATQQEKVRGSDAVLWLSPLDDCTIEEASTMNIFFHLKSGVITPGLRDTILAGITRRSAIELLSDRGITVQERDISIEEIKDAAMSGDLREAFVTSTALGVRTVDCIRIGQLKLGTSLDPSLSQSLATELKQVFAGNDASKSSSWIRAIGLCEE
ncbi:aminotransferase class IV [Verminephrobacter aporrectodeae]|uniref:aminotransferase class IV n=1 Tax=Verminephrobacter aporrectodeae TaxID=1110389 RepID=UPI002244DD5B|nr:aminotransferase class IV [Verminephrobacter aporrectodeae]